MLILCDLKSKKLLEVQFCSKACVQIWGNLNSGKLFFENEEGKEVLPGFPGIRFYRHLGFAVCFAEFMEVPDLNSYCRYCIGCGIIVNDSKSCSYHVGEVCPDRNFLVTESARLVAELFCKSTEKGSLTDAIWHSIERVLIRTEKDHLLYPELILKLAVEDLQ